MNSQLLFNNLKSRNRLLQANSYYPLGLLIKPTGTGSACTNEYFYQGKELDNENGLNWYDFHARLYDPVLGRWHTPDPAQQYVSPYMAMGDDPINRIDPNGMWDDDPCGSWSGGIRWDKAGNFFRKIWNRFGNNDGGGIITGEVVQELEMEFGSYNGFFLSGDAGSMTGDWGSYGGEGGGGGNIGTPYSEPASQYRGNSSNAVMKPLNIDFNFQANPYTTVIRGNGLSLGNGYNSGLQINSKSGGDLDINTWNNALSIAGLAWGITEKIMYNELFWLGANLKYNSISWGGNLSTGARSIARGLSTLPNILSKFAFYGNSIYSIYNVGSGISKGNYSGAFFSGLSGIYGSIGTYGGIPGMVIAGPLILIDATIGLKDFGIYQINSEIERGNRLSNGEWSIGFFPRLGQSVK
jgi:RHS repeat-associated protein